MDLPKQNHPIGEPLSLTIAIAVLGDALLRWTSLQLPKTLGIKYMFFVQKGSAMHQSYAAKNLSRADIKVVFLKSIGVAKSRNAALRSVDSDILLFADDDLDLLTNSYEALRAMFARNSTLAFICCQLQDTTGAPFKTYPRKGTKASKLNCGRIGTPEMAIAPKAFQDAGLEFDETFGAGTAQPSGEEYILLCDALNAGLVGCHIDISVGVHDGPSTGQGPKQQNPETLERVLRRAHPARSWFYRMGFAVKHIKLFKSPRVFLLFNRP